jgi:cytochrome c553
MMLKHHERTLLKYGGISWCLLIPKSRSCLMHQRPTSWLEPKKGAFFVLALYLFVLNAFSQEAPKVPNLYERAHASLCLSCHTLSSLSQGRDKDAFIKQLLALQMSPKKDHVMSQIARGLNQDQIIELANFFTRQEGPDL